MSRIGQKPIGIPAGVTVAVNGRMVTVKGPKGELKVDVPDLLKVTIEGQEVRVVRAVESVAAQQVHGTMRSIVANMTQGVSQGFTKELEIEGVGFKAVLQGQRMELSLGFASPVVYAVPDGVKATVDGGTKITLTGPDKQKVGDAAARVRAFFPAEPYKGKGLHYKGEYVRRKVGKTVA
jgi:large subunit ribosomal protein L6